MTYFSNHFFILRGNQALIVCIRMLSSDSVMLYYMPSAELFLLPHNTSQIHGLHCCFRPGLLSVVSLLMHCICCAVNHGLMLINLVFAFLFTFNIKFCFCSIRLFSLRNSLLVFSMCDIPLRYSVTQYTKLISDTTQLHSVLFNRMTCLQTILENILR
jgi:hypothetical protein